METRSVRPCLEESGASTSSVPQVNGSERRSFVPSYLGSSDASTSPVSRVNGHQLSSHSFEELWCRYLFFCLTRQCVSATQFSTHTFEELWTWCSYLFCPWVSATQFCTHMFGKPWSRYLFCPRSQLPSSVRTCLGNSGAGISPVPGMSASQPSNSQNNSGHPVLLLTLNSGFGIVLGGSVNITTPSNSFITSAAQSPGNPLSSGTNHGQLH